MGKARNSYQIQHLLDIAKEREAFRKNRKITTPKTYQKRADSETIYYRDFTTANKVLILTANTKALELIGGAAAVGLLSAIPAGSTPVTVRGLNYPIVKIHWFSGTDTPVAHTTAWGTRVIKYYKNADGSAQAFYSLPISVATGAFHLSDIITNFQALFNPNNGTKKALLGARGIAQLKIGKETLISLNT